MGVFRGRVTSGAGDRNRWMTLYADEYRAATGPELFPGSLNILLDDPWQLPARRLTIGPERVGRLVHLVPCLAAGRGCFIFRTENADRAGGDEHRKLELLADVRLRDELGVVDGDAVEVVVDDEFLVSPNPPR